MDELPVQVGPQILLAPHGTTATLKKCQRKSFLTNLFLSNFIAFAVQLKYLLPEVIRVK